MIKDYIKGSTTLIVTSTNTDISYEVYKTEHLFTVIRCKRYTTTTNRRNQSSDAFGNRPIAQGIPFAMCIQLIEERENAYDMGYVEPKNPTINMNKDIRMWRQKNGL